MHIARRNIENAGVAQYRRLSIGQNLFAIDFEGRTPHFTGQLQALMDIAPLDAAGQVEMNAADVMVLDKFTIAFAAARIR